MDGQSSTESSNNIDLEFDYTSLELELRVVASAERVLRLQDSERHPQPCGAERDLLETTRILQDVAVNDVETWDAKTDRTIVCVKDAGG